MKKSILGVGVAALCTTPLLFAGAIAFGQGEVNSGDQVILNGSESFTDKGGRKLRYIWKQVNITPETPVVTLTNRKIATTSFIAPEVDEATELRFRLTTIEPYVNEAGQRSKFKTRDFVDMIVFPEGTIKPADQITNFIEVEPDSVTQFRWTHSTPVYFTFTLDKTTKVKIKASDKTIDSFPKIFLRKGLLTNSEIIAQDVGTGDDSIVEIITTLEPGVYSVDARSDYYTAGIFELTRL